MTSSKIDREDDEDRSGKPSLGLAKLIRTYDDKRPVYVCPSAVAAVFDEGYDDFFKRHSCRIALAPGESVFVCGTPEEVLAALSQATAKQERSS